MKLLTLLILILPAVSFAQSSMRRCTLLPITDSVGGAIGFKVFEEIEYDLKKSNWCTYVSNSSLMSIFSRYRENLPQHLKTKQVLSTVAEKLKVGSLIRIGIVNEIRGVELSIDIYGEDGEDLYYSEKTLLKSNDVEDISHHVKMWLDMYSKMIPYDAKINGILGDQITLDVGKGYPIQVGQEFLVKRPLTKKKHPLLKKIVDWETEVLAEGKVSNISDNQALGLVRVYKNDKKIQNGDWVRLEAWKEPAIKDEKLEDKEDDSPGTLGIISVSMFGSNSSATTSSTTDTIRMGGNIFGLDLRAEGWITREWFAALEIDRSLGSMKKASGNPTKSSINVNNGRLKLTGGYKYLPLGFFYGPQIDIYGGYSSHTFDLDYSQVDGFGKSTFSGIVIGTMANIPVNHDYRFYARGELMPFPSFTDSDKIYGSASSVTAMEIEAGVKYQYRPRITFDGGIELISRKAKFGGARKELSFRDNRLKLGLSFNF